MIHTVKRDAVRMVSGEVLVVDELVPIEAGETLPEPLREFIARMDVHLGSVDGGWFVAYAYDRMDSVIAGGMVAIVARNIASVRALDVQIEAAEDAFDAPLPTRAVRTARI